MQAVLHMRFQAQTLIALRHLPTVLVRYWYFCYPAPQLVRSLLQSFRRQLADASAADVASLLWALRFVTQPYTQLVVRLHRRWAVGRGYGGADRGQGDSTHAGEALPGERLAEWVSLTRAQPLRTVCGNRVCTFGPSAARYFRCSLERPTHCVVSRGWAYPTSLVQGSFTRNTTVATTGNGLKHICVYPCHYNVPLRSLCLGDQSCLHHHTHARCAALGPKWIERSLLAAARQASPRPGCRSAALP